MSVASPLPPAPAPTSEPAAPAHIPTHPNHIQLHRTPGFHTSYTTSLLSVPPHTTFLPFSTPNRPEISPSTVPTPTWATVQTSATTHILLNSDLLYTNHSCKPTLVFDVEKMEARTTERGLEVGDRLSFFYPSTEWRMERGFECACAEEGCLGVVEGAERLVERFGGEAGERWWFNKWVREKMVEALKEREAKADK